MSAVEPVHSLWGYNRGCRCETCRAARKAWWADYAPRSLAALRPEQHGRVAIYRLGCRCEKCGEAKRLARVR